jgi:hypothetical protein
MSNDEVNIKKNYICIWNGYSIITNSIIRIYNIKSKL